MTVKQIADLLKELGSDVELRKRKDGGYLITKINGVRYKGAEGNRVAREMLTPMNIPNVQLSAGRAKQLKMIKPKKGTKPSKLEAIPEDVKTKIKDLQKKYKKASNKSKRDAGSIGIRHYRYMKKKYGEKEAREYLERAERYIEGNAYDENIYAIIQRIRMDEEDEMIRTVGGADKLEAIASKLEGIMNQGSIKTDGLNKIVEALYEMEQIIMTSYDKQSVRTATNNFYRRASSIIKASATIK